MFQSSDVNVLHWPGMDADRFGEIRQQSNAIDQIRLRLDGVLALIRAVEASEALAIVPEEDLARMQHQSVINLLLLAERELVCVSEQLQAK